MKKNVLQKIMSLLLAVVMVLGMIPVLPTVSAAEEETEPVVLDFLSFAKEVSGQKLWKSLRATSARGVKALGLKTGTQPTSTYTKALKDLESWMQSKCSWSIPDLYDGSDGHFNSANDSRKIYIDSYSGNYGIRLYTSTPGDETGSLFTLNFEVPAGKGGTYKMLVESFDEALSSKVPSCEGEDRGGATAYFYLNSEQIGDAQTFASETDEVVTRDYLRVELKEGTNELKIWITGDRDGNAVAGRCALNLRNITFGDPGPDCAHTEDSRISYLSNYNRTHEMISRCVTCGEKIEQTTVGCEDGDDENTLCDYCDFDLHMRGEPTGEFGKNSVVMDFMRFAYEAVQQPWFYQLKTASKTPRVRMMGNSLDIEATAEEIQAMTDARAYIEENYCWSIDGLNDGSHPYYDGTYGRRIFIDPIEDHYGIRFHTDYPMKQNSQCNRLTFHVDVPKADWYDMDIETFDEATTSMITTCDGPDNGGATCDIIVNDETVLENYTFANKEDMIKTLRVYAVYLEKGVNTIVFLVKGDRNGANGTQGRCALNLRSIELIPVGECKHLNPTENAVKNNGQQTHTIHTVCTCRTVLSSRTENCVDEDDDRVCDVCQQIMTTRPAPTRTFPEDSIVLDFMQFAYDAVQQPWWHNLRQSSMLGSGRGIGSPSGETPTEAQKQAIRDAEQYMKDNLNWRVVDMTSGNRTYLQSTGNRQIYIDALDDDYGIRFYTHRPGSGNDSSWLQLAFTVPEGKAGAYALDMEAVNEALSSSIPRHDSWDTGGATATIVVNGKEVVKGYLFASSNSGKAPDEIVLVHLGPANLVEGENTLTIKVTGDFWQTTAAGRCCLNLNYFEFKPLDGMETEEYLTSYLNLYEYYMPYGTATTGFTVKVDKPWIASAALNTQGVLSVTGIKAGQATAHVYNGAQIHCSVPLTVSGFDGSLDDLMGSPLKMDFVAAVDRAQEQSWWTGTGAVTVDGSFNTYLKETTKWNISEASNLIANGDDDTYGLEAKGKNTFKVDVPANGLYNITVEYLQGGGTMDAAVNGTTLCKGLSTAGQAATVKRSVGAANLKAGENLLTINAAQPVYLRSVTMTPLGVWQTEVGVSRHVALNETYLPYDADTSAYTATVGDETIAAAAFDAAGKLVITGVSEGTTAVTVQNAASTICTLKVNVIAAGKLREIFFTLDEFGAATLPVGETAVGVLSGATTNGTPLSEEYLRQAGSVYFKSSDASIAKLDQKTGDVTTVNEGTAVISAYVLLGGITTDASATMTVTDDTDLASIEAAASVDYVGVNNNLQLTVSGKKASGVQADMALYPVTWSVDDDTIAVISETGKLTARKEGTVTVTVTAAVQRVAITDTMVIHVVPTDELPGGDQYYDFVLFRNMDLQSFTMDTHDIAINRELTTNGGQDLTINSRGIKFDVVAGDVLALDFRIRTSGWYEVELRGSQEDKAVYANGFVDDTYIGDIEFNFGNTNGARGGYNTLWLDAGVHTLKIVSTEKGQIPFGGMRFYATSDPNEVTVDLTAEKTELIPGEKTALSVSASPANDVTFSLLQQSSKPSFTNYYILSSSDSGVVSVSGKTITANKVGTANVTMTGEVDGKAVSKTVKITVAAGTIAKAEITAEHTAVKPNSATFPLTVTAYGLDGKPVELPLGAELEFSVSDESIIKVDAQGNVTPLGKEGSSKVTVRFEEKGREITGSVWISVTVGKTAPSIWTYEERAIAQENVLKYDWAWEEKEAVVELADVYIQHVDSLYAEVLHPQVWAGNLNITFNKNCADYLICPMCETDLSVYNGWYPWIVDPINNPWKVTCPHCDADFPSNDFRSYYLSGIGEDGKFHEDLADPKYLVNELYPEKGEGWGVDDGWGWDTGKLSSNNIPLVYTIISHYIRKATFDLTYSRNDFLTILDTLTKAYLYTGDEKYGNAGAILVDRLADIYPTWDISDFPVSDYWDNDGNGGGGYQFGETWDGEAARYYAKATDAFWDCMDNQEVIDYISQYAGWKGMTPEEITPDYLRRNMEENILLHIWEGLQTADVGGNFGMPQSACAYTAVALDRFPETQEMLDWLFTYREWGGGWMQGVSYATGGGQLTKIINDVKRDGFGNEGSHSYNALWDSYSLETYAALAGYERVSSADMWTNSKVVSMYHAAARLMTNGKMGPNFHETSGKYQHAGVVPNIEYMTTAFVNTGDRTLARALYAFNGNTTAGIHGDIFTKDPEHGVRNRIEEIVKEDGEWEMAKSDMMAGYGIAMLREGPTKYVAGVNDSEYGSFWMYYGDTMSGHHKDQLLALDLAAFGLSLSGNIGYPLQVNTNPERQEWVANTVSGNTVVVNDRGQLKVATNNLPLHFTDDGYAKVMDADAAKVYEETDIYRRTVVAVDNGDGVHYAVDFFRILGGKEHVYSFHAATMTDPATAGLDLIKQPMGTYAGADVPFGPDPTMAKVGGTGPVSGYSWLDNVARDDSPNTVFSVDWPIKDFYNQLTTSTGIHLKLTMLSEKPMTEVATAHGTPPQDGRNPDYLEFLLVRNSGSDGLDTLFTTIVEPYQYNSYIAAVELVDMELIDGTENLTDRAAAVKVTLTSGRVDYVVYATNTECIYRVADLFDFQGFTGVVSYENGIVTYAWGDEATIVTDLITNAQPRITGEVLSFTEGLADRYEMTVSMDRPIPAEQLIGKWLYVNNDGVENGAYRIDGAEVKDNTAVIDLSFQTLIRKFVDEKNLDLGYIHNIAVGDTYELPLSTAFNEGQIFNHLFDTVAKTGTKLSLTAGVVGCGATYEVEGQPTGMKLDAVTGTITWTPAKAQAGRYPITVKAVKDGNVVAEMSFVIYAVTYSGSSFAQDVCSHAKVVTYNVDGVIETICPACGKIEKTGEEVIEKFDIAGANMTLGSDLKLNILVENEKLDDGDYTVKITHNGEVVEKALAPYNSAYSYAAYSVCAKQMSDVITAEIFKDGVAVSNVYETSVRNYAMNILNNGQLGKAVKTLVVDMLNYGAEAQKFFDYSAEDLANARLNAAQKALATDAVECKNYQVKGTNFYGTNVSLEDRIVLNLFFKNCEDGMTATISYTDYNGTAVSVDATPVVYSGNIYKVVVDEIVLADAFSPVTVTVYKDGAVRGSATDSVESYVARTGDSAINEAIMKFAYSAKQYLS